MAPDPIGHVIRSARAARAIASPVRQEIVDALENAGPSTIAELAAHMERPADGLYFHVRVLERVGLIKRVGEQGEGRGRAAVFDVAGRPMRLDYAGPVGRRAERLGPTLDCLLRLARRDVRRALAHPETNAEGRERELVVGRVRGRVGPGELARINALMEECLNIVRDSRCEGDGIPVALAVALTPLRKKRAGARAGATGQQSKARSRA